MKRLTLLAALTISGSLLFARSQSDKQSAAIKSPPSAQQDTLSAGKRLFVARCASCHDDAGDKPLPPGLPLNQRKLSEEVVARSVAGRLKSSPDADKRAVTSYILSFLKQK
jgi:mono/diheme cytochrome c family protein